LIGSIDSRHMVCPFVFGGALGNVFDRVRAGSVTDFLDFYFGTYHWYVFNLADTAIFIGAVLMILSMWRTRDEAGA
jgi:signal peptidase II